MVNTRDLYKGKHTKIFCGKIDFGLIIFYLYFNVHKRLYL
jgi:hypothetical protein